MVESATTRASARLRKMVAVLLAAITVFGLAPIPPLSASAEVAVADDAVRGQVIVYKYDGETGLSIPQGGASLEGAQFEITNLSGKTVTYVNEHGHSTSLANNESFRIPVKWDATLGAYVMATASATSTPYGLEKGTYNIREVSAGTGYDLPSVGGHARSGGYLSGDNGFTNTAAPAARWSNTGYTFNISAQGQIITFDGKATTVNEGASTVRSYTAGPGCYNVLKRHGLSVEKRDSDFLRTIAQGSGTLKGAVYNVYNDNIYPVTVWDHWDSAKVDGITLSSDAIAASVAPGGLVASIQGGDNMIAGTFMDTLPVGNYIVIEVRPPDGYDFQFDVHISGESAAALREAAATYEWGFDSESREFSANSFAKHFPTLASFSSVGISYVSNVRTSGTTTISGTTYTYTNAYRGYSNNAHEAFTLSNAANGVVWTAIVELAPDVTDGRINTANDDPVKRGGVEFKKVDYDFGYNASSTTSAQGDAVLGGATDSGAGARIRVYNDNDAPVYIYDQTGRTDNGKDYYGVRGSVASGGIVGEVMTDANGIAHLYQLPVGSYHAVEVSPSTGYDITGPDEWYYEFEIADSNRGNCNVGDSSYDVTTTVTSTEDLQAATADGVNKSINTARNARTADKNGRAYADANLREHVMRSGYLTDPEYDADGAIPTDESKIPGVKSDAESGLTGGSGGSSLAGTKLVIRNISDQPVVWTDVSNSLSEKYMKRTWTVETPVGTEAASGTAFSAGDGDVVELVCVPINNKGEAVLYDSGEHVGEFVTENPAVWNAAQTQKERAIYAYAWRVYVGNSDGTHEYVRLTGMPYGTYQVRESYATPGYDINADYTQRIVFHPGTESVITWSGTAAEDTVEATTARDTFSTITLQNSSRRLDIGWAKKDEYGHGIANVAFRVTSETTGESHIIVTDANGKVDTRAYQASATTSVAAMWRLHNVFTNWSDDAVSSNDVTDAKLDWRHGTWFYGYSDGVKFGAFGQTYGYDTPAALAADLDTQTFYLPTDTATGTMYPFNLRGALPADTYTIEELRCAANAGKTLIKPITGVKVGVDGHGGNGAYIDLGTLTDRDYSGDDGDIVTPGADESAFVELTATPATSSTVRPATDIVYTMNYQNTSTETIPTLIIRNSVPDNTSFKDVADDGAYDEESNYVEWAIHDVEPGAEGSVSYTVTIAGNPSDPVIVDQARYQALDEAIDALAYGGVPYGATNVVRHTIGGAKVGGNLTAKLTSEPVTGSDVDKGSKIKYTITVINDGDEAVNNVAIHDYVPTGTTLSYSENDGGYDVADISDGGRFVGGGIGWMVGYLGAGDSKSVNFTVTVNDDAYGLINNQATFGYAGSTPTADVDGGRTNYVTHNVTLAKDIQFEKTADKDTVNPGDTITYRFKVTNAGESNEGPFTIQDALPEHTVFVEASDNCVMEPVEGDPAIKFEVGTLRHGGNANEDSWFTVRADMELAAGTQIKNTAALADDSDSWESDEVVVTVADAAATSLKVAKTSDPEDGSYVKTGDTVTYTIAWENDSDADVYGLALRDAIPEGTTFDEGSIKLVQDGVSSDDTPVTPHDESAVRTGTSAEEGTFTEGTAMIAGRYSSTMPDTDAVFRFITAKDDSYGTASLVRDADKTIPGWDAVDSYLGNSRRAAGDWIEFESTNASTYNLLWHAVILDSGQIKLAAMYLTPADTNIAVMENGVANYDSARNAVRALVDKVEAHTSGSITFTVTVTAADGTDISNKGTYDAGVTSLSSIQNDLGHETNSVMLTVGEPVDLTDETAAVKTVSPEGPVHPGDKLTYTVSVTNTGTAVARGVGIYDEIPRNAVRGVLFVPGTYEVIGGSSICDEYGADLTSDIRHIGAYAETLEPNETLTMKFQVVCEDVAEGDVIKNFATWGTGCDGIPENALASKTETVETPITSDKRGADMDVQLTQNITDGARIGLGSTVTYTLDFKNNGDGKAFGVGSNMPIPAGTTFVAGSLASEGVVEAAYSEADGAIEMYASEFAPTDTGKVTFTVTTDEVREVVAGATWNTDLDAAPRTTQPRHTIDLDVIVVRPDVSVTLAQDKTDGERIGIGDAVTYTVTIANGGDDIQNAVEATNIGVFMPVPDGTEYVDGTLSFDADEITVSATDGAFGAHVASLGVGESASFSYTVATSEAREVVAQATWGFDAQDVPISALKTLTTDKDVLVVAPTLRIVKSQTPPSGSIITWGDTLAYDIKVTNTGAVDAHKVAIYDWAPDNTTYVEKSLEGEVAGDKYAIKGTATKSGDTVGVYETLQTGETVKLLTMWAGTLTPGDTATMHFEVTVNDDFLGTIHNTASWVSPAADPSTYADWGNDSNGTNADAGGSNATGGATALAFMPVLAAPTLPIPDGSETGESNDTADNNDDDGNDNGDNSGNSQTQPTDSNEPDNAGEGNGSSNDVNGNVVAPVVTATVAADVDDGAVVDAGSNVTYTVKVANDGEVAMNGYIAKVELPNGVTPEESDDYTIGDDGNIYVAVSPEPGKAETITIKAKVNDDADGTLKTVVSTGRADSGKYADVEKWTEGNSHTMFVGELPIQIVKSADVADGAYVKAGDEITYTLEVTNNDTKARDVKVSDKLPSGLTYVANSASDDGTERDNTITWNVSVDAGKSKTLTFKAKVADDATGDITNAVAWDAGDAKGDSGEHKLNVGTPSLQVAKISSPAAGTSVAAGDEITYTITVSNAGTADAKATITDVSSDNVTIVEASLPSGMTLEDGKLTWSGTVKAGASQELTYKATVNDGATGEIRNVVACASDSQATVSNATNTLLVVRPDISVTKTASAAEAADGDNVVYTVKVANTGDGAGAYTLADKLPEGLTFVSSASDGLTYADGVLNASATLKAGGVDTYEYTCTVSGKAGDELTNSVTVTTPSGVRDIKSDATVKVVDVARDLVVAKTVDGDKTASVKVGEQLAYQVVVANAGERAADVELSDTLPAGLELDENSIKIANGDAKVVNADANVVRATTKLGVGETFTVTYDAVVNSDASGDIVNTAEVKSAYASAVSSATVSVAAEQPVVPDDNQSATLSIEKTAGTKTFTSAGDVISYKLVATNKGDTDVTATIYDVPRNGLAFTDFEDGKVVLLDKDGGDVAYMTYFEEGKEYTAKEYLDAYGYADLDVSKLPAISQQIIAALQEKGNEKFEMDITQAVLSGVNLKAGESVTYYVNCTVPEKPAETLVNTAVVSDGGVVASDNAEVKQATEKIADNDTAKSENKGSLPETGTGLIVFGLITAVAAAAAVAFILHRRRMDPTRRFR